MEIREAVRVFAFKDNQVVCIKYKNLNKDYFDIPGGKIEDNETEIEACKREFYEETGMNIENLKKIGVFTTYYPHINKKYILNTYKTENTIGTPKEFEDNYSFWINIEKLIEEKSRFAITHLLDDDLKSVFEKNNVKITFICDEKHNIKEIIKEESE